jgi:L-serine dehydratase
VPPATVTAATRPYFSARRARIPATVDTCTVDERVLRIRGTGRLRLLGRQEVDFREREHLVLHRRRTLPFHPNGMRFQALEHDGRELSTRTYHSVGGSFVVDGTATGADRISPDDTSVRLPFHSGSELLRRAYESGCPSAE